MPKSYLIGGKGQGGLQNDLKPFWLADQAYQFMENVFAWRERIRKKPAWRKLGRLRRLLTAKSLGNTDGDGLLSGNLTTLASLESSANIEPGSLQITIGTQYYTDNSLGSFNVGKTITGATQTNPCEITSNGHGLSNGNTVRITGVVGMTQLNNQTYTVTVTGVNTFTIGIDASIFPTPYASGGGWVAISPPSTTGSINYASTAISLQTSPVLATTAVTANFGYYPGLPVQGIVGRELTTLNFEQGVFFDTKYAYDYVASGFVEFTSNTPTTWTNTAINSNYFWSTNYYASVPESQALWVTNNIDNIRYYDTASSPPTWTTITPSLDGVPTPLNACLLLTPFKGYLVAFNTLEGTKRFRQRARWCQNTLIGPPNGGSTPTCGLAWRSDIPGRGGFIDAPISQAIVSLKNLKDRLIVYFERSTWEFVFTGNDTLPFIWRQLNQELGSESTFSSVPFDNGIMAVGNVGIHTCNGVNVVRFDEKIPDEVFKIDNEDDGPQRVSGIRDYQLENVYWTYPDKTEYSRPEQFYPNKVFCYNYRNNTWAKFDESFTVFGYYQPNTGYTWDTLPYANWDSWDEPWNSGLSNARNPIVAAGNQQGFVFSFNKQDSAYTDYSLYIQDITNNAVTSPNHNLKVGDYIIFNYSNILGVTFNQTAQSFRVTLVLNVDQFYFDGSVTGTYLGNGLIQKLDNFNLSTKEFNPFVEEGQECRFTSVDFLVDKQSGSGFEARFYLNDSQSISNPPVNGTNEISLSASNLVPLQANQDTFWRRKNLNAIGQYIQIEMQHSDDQMRNPLIPQSDFVLHAMNIRLDPSGRINPS
jgi:hypothetical protein